jgi:RNA polymerase sigma-70 factor (ECF subfamily)
VASDANRAKLRRAFDAHYEAVSRYCHRRLPAGDANDAAAQVFAVAWRKADDMPDGEATLPWLYGVARYEVSSAWRSQRRRRNLQEKLDGQARHPEPGPEVVVMRRAEQSELMAALGTLRAADQEVLRLRAFEGLTMHEVAVVLGCSVEAAKKRSARAMRRLRRAAGIVSPVEASAEAAAVEEGGLP